MSYKFSDYFFFVSVFICNGSLCFAESTQRPFAEIKNPMTESITLQNHLDSIFEASVP